MFLYNSDCKFDQRSALVSSIITHLDPYSKLVNPKRWNENRDLHHSTFSKLADGDSVPTHIGRHLSEETCIDYEALHLDVDAWVAARYSSAAASERGEIDALARHVLESATQLFCRRSFTETGPYQTGARSETAAAILIPFRARDPRDGRLRNLVNTLDWLQAACKSFPNVRTVVVEADSIPRHRSIVEAHGGAHVFLRNDGQFNKAAAVNQGYKTVAGSFRNICILDSDGYLDAHFLSICLNAFDAPGTPALMPFRDLFFLDSPSTIRVLSAGINHCGNVTGYVTRLSPGVCFWISADLFEAVGGFDEHFEGWGGEDRGFFTKIEAITPVVRLPGVFAHMFHERAPEIRAWVNSGSKGEWRHNYRSQPHMARTPPG